MAKVSTNRAVGTKKSQGEFITRSIAGDSLVIGVFSCWGKTSLIGKYKYSVVKCIHHTKRVVET